jgi:heme-degrading monooxygenase HmoA
MNESTVRDASSSPAPARPGGFAVVSQFTVANGMTEAVKTAFRQRLRQVEHAPGFVRLEVLSPLDCPDELWLLTFWRDEASFRSWYRSHDYHQAHKGIPKGLKLVPGRTIIRHFEHVCS